MKKSLKITLIVVLALAVGIGAAAIGIYAAIRPWTAHTGQLGDHVYYSYDAGSRTVVVYGEGAMWDFDYAVDVPYTVPEDTLLSVRGTPLSPFNLTANPGSELTPERLVILPGVESVGEWAFRGSKKLTSAFFPEGFARIAGNAFRECESLTELCFAGDAPELSGVLLGKDTVTIYAPADSAGWDSADWQNFAKVEQNVSIPLKYRLVGWCLETFWNVPEE